MTVLLLPCAEMYAYVHHWSTKKCHLSDSWILWFPVGNVARELLFPALLIIYLFNLEGGRVRWGQNSPKSIAALSGLPPAIQPVGRDGT